MHTYCNTSNVNTSWSFREKKTLSNLICCDCAPQNVIQNCPDGSCPGWELSVGIVQVGIFRVRIVLKPFIIECIEIAETM